MTANPPAKHMFPAVAALGRWSTIAIGFTVPISIALDNLLLAIMLLAWLFSTHYSEKISLAWRNPVYRAALLLFTILVIGTSYGRQAPGDAGLYLSKYADLALIPLLGWSFVAARERQRGVLAIACSLALVLILSYAVKFGVMPSPRWLQTPSESPVVFKLRLTHNILMAYGAFIFMWLALTTSQTRFRMLWSSAAVMAVINVTLMVNGVTGYLVLAGLFILFSWQQARWRGLMISGLAGIVLTALLLNIPGPFQKRINGVMNELLSSDTGRPATSSDSYRFEFYRNTFALIKENPLLGTGTGSFPAVYAAQVRGSGSIESKNPHNEFLLIAVQTGLVGLALFIWLLWQQWRHVPLLPTPLERGLAQGLVVTIIVVCMFNSALLDHTEGLLYAWLTALLYAGLGSRQNDTSPAPA
jgi:O-antigen ligase